MIGSSMKEKEEGLFFYFIFLKIYLLIFGCAGCSLLWAFSSCSEQGVPL